MNYMEALEKHEKDCRRCREKICKYESKKFSCLQEIDIKAYKELLQYRQIGTLEEVREAVEKQHPKTPTWDGDGYAPDGTFVWDEWKCPRCGTRYEVEYDDYDYCPNCGQRIYLHADWSEEDD